MEGTHYTLSVKEAADYLGVQPEMIYVMVQMKELPHLKLGERLFFTRESIDLWKSEQRVMSTQN